MFIDIFPKMSLSLLSQSKRDQSIGTACDDVRAAFPVCVGCAASCVYMHSVHLCLLGTCSAVLLGGPGDK